MKASAESRPRATGHGLWALAIAIGALCSVATAQSPRPASPQPASSQAAPRAATRIISLVPAVTEMLFAIGAGPHVIAVSSFDHFPAAVESLPRVGALLDPDTERILSLKPDLVMTYGSQTDLGVALTRAGIRTYSYRHGGIEDTLQTIRQLGPLTGTEAGAAAAASGLRARVESLRRRVAGRGRPRTLLAFERQPGTLRGVYAAGGVGFMHDILEVAGATNVFADVKKESVQPSHELLITRRPDVVVELHASDAADATEALRAWSVLPSVPAVRTGRIHALSGAYLAVAGPRLADAAETIAKAIHPGAF